jgi:hypothetical protein
MNRSSQRQRRLQEYPADRPVRVAADELDDEPAALLARGHHGVGDAPLAECPPEPPREERQMLIALELHQLEHRHECLAEFEPLEARGQRLRAAPGEVAESII